MRLLFVVINVLLFAQGFGVSDLFVNERGSLNDKIEELIPKDARKFYNELSAEDKQVLEEVVSSRGNFSTIDAVLESIKSRSSVLYDKANSIVKEFNDSLDSLGPEAKEFVDYAISRFRQITTSLNMAEVKALIEKFQQLSPEAREDLKNGFPVVATVFQNPIFQSLSSTFLGINYDSFPTPGSFPQGNGDDIERVEPPIMTVQPQASH